MKIRPSSFLLGALGLGFALHVTSFASAPDERYKVLRELSGHLSVEYLDDGAGGLAKTFRFTGVNVQIVNGLGATNGNPADPTATAAAKTTTNSLGNLIVGYDEPTQGNLTRVGSHNLVVGTQAAYESFGGLAVGLAPKLRGAYAAAIAGNNNRADGDLSVVLGGVRNEAEGRASTCTGGFENRAIGEFSLASGGRHNTATASTTTVVGGSANRATSWLATVTGGAANHAQGRQSTVSGGFRNIARGEYATVNGGEGNIADGPYASIAFGLNRRISAQNQSGNRSHDGVAGSLWEDD
jgi:hypothetical protein